MDDKWDIRFLKLARFVSQWSKDPSTKVGAVIVNRNKQIVSLGYNGLPQNIMDDPDILNNRELKYKYIVHAEMNALRFAERSSLKDCTLYTYPFQPCSSCAPIIVQYNIPVVVTLDIIPNRWYEDFKVAKQILLDGGVEIITFPENII